MAHHTGVVDEDVNPPQPASYGVRQLDDRRLVGDISLDDPARAVPDIGRKVPRRVARRAMDKSDGHTLVDQGQGDRAPDAARGAGHHGILAGQAEVKAGSCNAHDGEP